MPQFLNIFFLRHKTKFNIFPAFKGIEKGTHNEKVAAYNIIKQLQTEAVNNSIRKVIGKKIGINYEEIDKKAYEQLCKKVAGVDFSKLFSYEQVDNTQGAKELACVGGACEI